MVAAIIRFLADGNELASATQRSCTILLDWKGHEETSQAIEKALDLARNPSSDHVASIQALGEGWVGEEALAIALFSALTGNAYVEVIRIAANHDGDNDSTASIAGQLWGAWKGLEGIPHDWITRLDVLLPALHLARLAEFITPESAQFDGV